MIIRNPESGSTEPTLPPSRGDDNTGNFQLPIAHHQSSFSSRIDRSVGSGDARRASEDQQVSGEALPARSKELAEAAHTEFRKIVERMFGEIAVALPSSKQSIARERKGEVVAKVLRVHLPTVASEYIASAGETMAYNPIELRSTIEALLKAALEAS
jgi:hypothetical protein